MVQHTFHSTSRALLTWAFMWPSMLLSDAMSTAASQTKSQGTDVSTSSCGRCSVLARRKHAHSHVAPGAMWEHHGAADLRQSWQVTLACAHLDR